MNFQILNDFLKNNPKYLIDFETDYDITYKNIDTDYYLTLFKNIDRVGSSEFGGTLPYNKIIISNNTICYLKEI